MTTYPQPTAYTTTAAPRDTDYHVLVLFTDDTESLVKGLWGPYTSFDVAAEALDELRLWPLDGHWDVRRLNKFVALKSGGTPDTLSRVFTWQNDTTGSIR